MPVGATTPQSCGGLRLCVIPDARHAITRDRVRAKDQGQGPLRRTNNMNVKTLLILTPALLSLSLSAQAQPGYPPGAPGDVLTVDFTVFGVPCLGLNGGDRLQQSEAHGEPDRCRIP